MSIAAVGPAQVMPTGTEKAEGPGPDHDGDGDDGGSVQTAVQAAPTPGSGTVVDKTA
jgi:hypothetical protein